MSSNVTCRFCQRPAEAAQSTTCRGCGAIDHRACRLLAGGCQDPGCDRARRRDEASWLSAEIDPHRFLTGLLLLSFPALALLGGGPWSLLGLVIPLVMVVLRGWAQGAFA